MSKPPVLRCAVYTRKSSEEGLDQDYNSLHAQRDACESYIKSQVGEGWTCLKTAYDDGGISGGTMDRPGLKQLLADIAARKIDVVVVYKVDRLTRALMDFAKIVEIFDKHGVSFVSVTQAFNTTSSMGRLTLNVLLSFAQFEREVTGERIRDKIAQSKAKGMWMGGGVPLGYVAEGRTLKIVEGEAETVRYIFRRYLELKSVHRLKVVLGSEGVRSKLSVFSTGRTRGGCSMDRGSLFTLLSNPAYLGKIKHKDLIHDGLHPAIIDQATFDAVAEIIAVNRVKRTSGSARRTESALVGKLFDQDGSLMTPTFAIGRAGKRYRYYISSGLTRGGTVLPENDGVRRLPGPQIETFVLENVARLVTPEAAVFVRACLREQAIDLVFAKPSTMDDSEWDHSLERISGLLKKNERAWRAGADLIVSIGGKIGFRGGRSTVVGAPASMGKVDRVLVEGLRRAHRMTALASISPLTAPADNIRSKGFGTDYEKRLARLAFLAPDLQVQIMAGQQPAHVTLERLLNGEMPSCWTLQRSWTWLA